MTLYKRASTWWTDFTVGGRRYRVSLSVSDRREAVRLERIRIAEAQNKGDGLIQRVAGVTVAEAGEVYLLARQSYVSSSTVRLERDALKPVGRHLGKLTLAGLRPGTLTSYVDLRKTEAIANRTINIEMGAFRRVLKIYKLWQLVGGDYKPLPERRDVGRALTPEQEVKLFEVAASRSEWSVAFWASLVAANTTATGCELRNLRLGDINMDSQTMYVRVGKNRFRIRPVPLNRTALWAVEQLLDRARRLGATTADHYLIPRRVSGKTYDPAQPPSRWAWRTAWRKLTEACGLSGLRPHDLRHHAITRLAESSEASEQTIMAIAGHVSREMLEHYSHIRQDAKRKAVASLDNVTITAQLPKWKTEADARMKAELTKTKGEIMVGMGRFELPTPRTPSGSEE
jgi:integrase